jgi:hypothetical protein
LFFSDFFCLFSTSYYFVNFFLPFAFSFLANIYFDVERYFIAMNPKIRSTEKIIVRILKYFSIKTFTLSPKKKIKVDTMKNLADLDIREAIIKIGKFIENTPADIVKTLYGIGVKPAVKTAMKAF